MAVAMATMATELTNMSSKLIQGRYELISPLGQGSFARVYLALDKQTNNKVAIKIMAKQLIYRHNLSAHILREIDIMKRVRHPNIVQLIELMASKNDVCLVMEYVSGGELFHRINAGRLPEHTARRYFQQLITAVEFCHARGVFHRDLKPQNLLISKENEDLKITDFGLSVVVEKRRNDLLQDFVGTPAFMAPEVISRNGYDGAKSDIWSCGIILFMMMAGHLPFKGKEREETYAKIKKGDFQCPIWFSKELEHLVQGILCVDTAKRMSILEIKKHPWFNTDYQPSKFYVDNDKIFFENENDELESGYESDSSIGSTLPARQNLSSITAFDIISFSSGFNLSGLFEETGEQRRFVSSRPLNKIVSELLNIAKLESYKTRIKDSLMILQGFKEGPKGPLMIAIEISQLTSEILVLHVKKKAGDLTEYNEFLDNVLKPRLKYLVAESPLVRGQGRILQTPAAEFRSLVMSQKPPLPSMASPLKPSSSRLRTTQMFSPKHVIMPGKRTPGRRHLLG